MHKNRQRSKEEKDITIGATSGLLYLAAVLNEGLRICNTIPGGLPRVTPEGGDTYDGVYLTGDVSRTYLKNRSETNNQFLDQTGSPYLCCQSFNQIFRESRSFRARTLAAEG